METVPVPIYIIKNGGIGDAGKPLSLETVISKLNLKTLFL